jgi:beta-fructofuranosidase
MVFRLPDSWVWDFWLVDDGQNYHMFFLFASRALKDPDARHDRASIGHAVSGDLGNWTRVEDALVRSNAPAFDDLATWTGSIVKHPDGRWFMFYTGSTRPAAGSNIHTIGFATSADLIHWEKGSGPVLSTDDRWYERLADGRWHDEEFRDPWVFPDPGGTGWHMLITARAASGPPDYFDRGVIGHGWSADLTAWELRAPLTEPGQGFGHLEVLNLLDFDHAHFVTFSCLAQDAAGWRRASGTTGGVWAARAETPLGPYDIEGAQLLTTDELYVGRFIRDRTSGDMMFLAFINEVDGIFVGAVTDPMKCTLKDGRIWFVDNHGVHHEKHPPPFSR